MTRTAGTWDLTARFITSQPDTWSTRITPVGISIEAKCHCWRMIEPKRMEDMAQSIVLMYQQGGWVDRWPQINRYTNVMAGSPLTVVLATAWLDGLHGFDINAGWDGMLKDATEAPPPGNPYIGEDGIDWINKLHYVPTTKPSMALSRRFKRTPSRTRHSTTSL